MSELAYLGFAILLSVGGSFFFLRQQRRPETLESGVQQFSRGIDALATCHADSRRRQGSSTASGK